MSASAAAGAVDKDRMALLVAHKVAGVSDNDGRPSVFLLRHGATEWSESGQHTGLTDIPLTDQGEDEARELIPLVAGRRFALVLSSPLSRALRSAELAGLADIEIEPDLLEWDYGKVEGRTTADMRKDEPDWNVFASEIPGGETAEQVGERVDRVIARSRAVDGEVLLVGHGHCLRILAARWLDLEPRDGRLLHLASGTLSELAWEREQPVIRTWGLRGQP